MSISSHYYHLFLLCSPFFLISFLIIGNYYDKCIQLLLQDLRCFLHSYVHVRSFYFLLPFFLPIIISLTHFFTPIFLPANLSSFLTTSILPFLSPLLTNSFLPSSSSSYFLPSFLPPLFLLLNSLTSSPPFNLSSSLNFSNGTRKNKPDYFYFLFPSEYEVGLGCIYVMSREKSYSLDILTRDNNYLARKLLTMQH